MMCMWVFGRVWDCGAWWPTRPRCGQAQRKPSPGFRSHTRMSRSCPQAPNRHGSRRCYSFKLGPCLQSPAPWQSVVSGRSPARDGRSPARDGHPPARFRHFFFPCSCSLSHPTRNPPQGSLAWIPTLITTNKQADYNCCACLRCVGAG